MSHHPAFHSVDGMEGDIRDWALWASVLNRMATASDPMDPEDIWLTSKVLSAMAKRLDAHRPEALCKVGKRA
jgi:hypothetical protein